MPNLALQAATPLFTISSIDTESIIATITANAPTIIGAAITIILVKKAVPLVPAMVNKMIK